MKSPQLISPLRLAELLKDGPLRLIDVRTPAEFDEVHVVGAENVPLDRFDPATIPSGPVYLICRSGGRGAKACDVLIQAGRAEVFNIEGGTQACDAAGLPVVRGRKAMSLERQVRIVAGTLVVTGLTAGFLIHEGFFGLSGFVGAGLVVAGVTDTCTMGMILARMPWNQRAVKCA